MTSPTREIDKLPTPSKTQEMKVLCLSAPRSGSTSTGQALKILGYTPFAGVAHNYFHDNRFSLWTEAIEAAYHGQGKRYTREDFDKFLAPYDAVHGWAAAMLAEDLFAAYPDAKVILTTRDPDKWVESWDGTVVTLHKWWRKWWWVPPLAGGVLRDFRRYAEMSLYAWSDGHPFEYSQQRRMYADHNRRVREMVPKEQLLELDVKGGWEPLCRFLGKEEPTDQPYPHGSDRDRFHMTMNRLKRQAVLKALLRLAVGFGMGGAGISLIFRCWRSINLQRIRGYMPGVMQ